MRLRSGVGVELCAPYALEAVWQYSVVAGYGSGAVSGGRALGRRCSIADPNARGVFVGRACGDFACLDGGGDGCGGAVLWFWLLRRMELSEFSAQTVAALVAVLFVQFVWFGLLSWRVDLALTLSVGAMWTALRGGPDDEGPVRLGLAGEG